MVHALGHEGGVKDDAVEHFLLAFALLGAGQGGKLLVKEVLAEFGDELVHRVVVMDAVAKPHLFQVFNKGQIVFVGLVALVVAIDVFKGLTHHQVIFAVLVKQNVAAVEGSLGEVIDQLLLLERQVLKAGHLVAQHLDVGKTVNRVVEVTVLCHSGSS